MSLISLSIFVCIRNKKVDHTILNPTLMHKATTHKKQNCRNRKAVGAITSPLPPTTTICKSVNTVKTGGGDYVHPLLLRIISTFYGPARDIDPFDRKVLCLK